MVTDAMVGDEEEVEGVREGVREDWASGPMTLREIRLDHLVLPPSYHRTEEDPKELKQLGGSLKQHGQLYPLLVRPLTGQEDRFEVVSGGRRLLAARRENLETLICRIEPWKDAEAAVLALVENVHRKDLHPLDRAAMLHRVKELTGKTWEGVADEVQLGVGQVKAIAGLVELTLPVQEHLRRHPLPLRSALALRPLPPEQQLDLAQRATAEELSAEEIRAARLSLAAPAPDGPEAPKRVDPELDLEGDHREAETAGDATTDLSPEMIAFLREIQDVLQERRERLTELPWAAYRSDPAVWDALSQTVGEIERFVVAMRPVYKQFTHRVARYGRWARMEQEGR